MTRPHDFGELRSLLAATPSARAFDATLDLVEAALPQLGEGAYFDKWAPYLEAQLQRWPDPTRRVRDTRLHALEEGPTVWAPLVRTLEYARSTISESRCEAICAAEHLSGVTQLDLRGASTSYRVLHQLAAGAPFVLEAFALRKSTSSGAKPADLLPLFTSPMLSRLSSLELTGWARFGVSSVKAMIENLPLTNLKRLDLNGTGVGKSGLKAILECEGLNGLEWLDLRELEFGKKQVEALVDATHLNNLKHLCLRSCSFSPALIGDMSLAPHIHALESLDLGRNRLTVDDMRALCAPELYPNLRALEIRDPLEPEALEVLLSSECFARVTSLSLTDVPLDAGAIQAAASWPALEALHLDEPLVGVEAWRALMQSPLCDGLETLRAQRLIDPKTRADSHLWTIEEQLSHRHALMLEVLSVPMPVSLEHLDLSSNKLRAEHLERLLAQACIPNLRSLGLSSSIYRYRESNSASLRVLAQEPRLANLRALSIHTIADDQEALEELVRSEHLGELRLVELSSRVSSERLERLESIASSRLRVRRLGDDEGDR